MPDPSEHLEQVTVDNSLLDLARTDPMDHRVPPWLGVQAQAAQIGEGVLCQCANHHRWFGWRGDLLGVGVMCQMCGQWFAPVQDTCVTHDGVPEHRRPDILAMIERGDFDEK